MNHFIHSMKYSLLFFLLISLATCYSDNEKNKEEANNEGANTNIQNSTSDEQVTRRVVRDFLKWYSMNTDLQNNLVNAKEGIPYSVNFEETEKYLKKLQSTGFISEKYINDFRVYFKKCDQRFKKEPITKGLATGFDFDFIMFSQEYEEDLKGTEKTRVLTLFQDTNNISLQLTFLSGMKLTYKLSKCGETWKIDSIGNE